MTLPPSSAPTNYQALNRAHFTLPRQRTEWHPRKLATRKRKEGWFMKVGIRKSRWSWKDPRRKTIKMIWWGLMWLFRTGWLEVWELNHMGIVKMCVMIKSMKVDNLCIEIGFFFSGKLCLASVSWKSFLCQLRILNLWFFLFQLIRFFLEVIF